MNLNKEQTMQLMSAPMGPNFSIHDIGTFANTNTSGSIGLASACGQSTTNAFHTVADNGAGGSTAGGSGHTAAYSMSGWNYWQNYYYPYVIRESYPVYIKERAEDKGKQAFEILKSLQDKKLLNIDKVENFIEAMDCLIKVL